MIETVGRLLICMKDIPMKATALAERIFFYTEDR